MKSVHRLGALVLIVLINRFALAAMAQDGSGLQANNVVSDSITPDMLARETARKQHMSEEELAWELTLEKNLGDYYLPRYYEDKDNNRESAWDYVKDDPRLPRLLIIGDSISRGYTVSVRHLLEGKFNVHRAPANCGATESGLANLDLWLGEGKWDVILWNFGIHDRNTEQGLYEKNLQSLLNRLHRTNAKVVWALTTPPPPSGVSQEGLTMLQVEQLNRSADEVMTRNAIPEIDLFNLVLPRLGKLQIPNSVHFTDEGYTLMADEIASTILSIEGSK